MDSLCDGPHQHRQKRHGIIIFRWFTRSFFHFRVRNVGCQVISFTCYHLPSHWHLHVACSSLNAISRSLFWIACYSHVRISCPSRDPLHWQTWTSNLSFLRHGGHPMLRELNFWCNFITDTLVGIRILPPPLLIMSSAMNPGMLRRLQPNDFLATPYDDCTIFQSRSTELVVFSPTAGEFVRVAW